MIVLLCLGGSCSFGIIAGVVVVVVVVIYFPFSLLVCFYYLYYFKVVTFPTNLLLLNRVNKIPGGCLKYHRLLCGT